MQSARDREQHLGAILLRTFVGLVGGELRVRRQHFREQSGDLASEQLRVVQRSEIVLKLRKLRDQLLCAIDRWPKRFEQITKTLRGDARFVTFEPVADIRDTREGGARSDRM